MSDLARFRDHCLAMGSTTSLDAANKHLDAAQRALFRRLADEVDAYLAHDHDVNDEAPSDDGPGLFDQEVAR